MSYKILSLDGGGAWALIQVKALQKIYGADTNGHAVLSRFDMAQIRSQEDGYWIAGGDGIIRFDPRVKSSGEQSFATLVRQVSSGASDVVFGGTPLAAASAISLPYDRNSLRFEFAAPTYGDEGETTYQYFLEGADKDWSAWGKEREANYGRLGPGSYRFVSASVKQVNR